MVGRPTRAFAAPSCAADAAGLRADLQAEAKRTSYWHWGWVASYGALTAGQLALAGANWNPLGGADRAFRDSRYVGGAESGVGLVSMLLAPGIDVPDPAGAVDACADLAALREARAKAARSQRLLFYGSHAGNFVVNAAGSLVLAKETSWSNAAVAFALGYAIGLLNTYTMPRTSWHAVRVAPVPVADRGDRGVALAIIGAF